MAEVIDTIYARASAAGRAGVCVFRLSGPAVPDLCKKLLQKTLTHKTATLVKVRGQDDHLIDEGLALLFVEPASFTGEYVLELHLHGSRAVELDLFETLSGLGARLAEPGEFTLRAMKNGKLDLPRVEALADLIDSETTLQKKQALGQLSGLLSNQLLGWRALLLNVLTPLAADIDFPDEDDVPAAIAANALPAIDDLVAQLDQTLSGAGRARQIRKGANIVLIGPPNVGKSSLLNRLAGSDIAIVSDQPGTTRDVVEARLDLGGMLVTVADTAGLRTRTSDKIEEEGMRRTKDRAIHADIRILVLDSTLENPIHNVSRETLKSLNENDLVVLNKLDITQKPSSVGAVAFIEDLPVVCVSAKTGEGISSILELLQERLFNKEAAFEGVALTRQRHVDAINEAKDALMRARENVLLFPELASEDLRLASRAFDKLVGAIDVEDILGEIFSSFCIGK